MQSIADILKLFGAVAGGTLLFVVGHRYWELRRKERDLGRILRKAEEDEIVHHNGSLDFNDLIKRESERFSSSKPEDPSGKSG